MNCIIVQHLIIILLLIPNELQGYGAMELRLQEQRSHGTAEATKPETAAVEAQPVVASEGANASATKSVNYNSKYPLILLNIAIIRFFIKRLVKAPKCSLTRNGTICSNNGAAVSQIWDGN